MSQERVKEILSHVDMSKIDLSSFKISERKFNELSTLYRNRVILSCVSMIANKSDHDREYVEQAFSAIERVVENPNLYTYATIYANERRAVDEAINDIVTYRDRSINDVKIKAIERRMKDAYKQMRKTIEMALENGNTFEYEFDDATVEKCLQIAKDAIENGRKKVAEANVNASPYAEPQAEHSTTELNERAECENRENAIGIHEQREEMKSTKISFWKRIFTKTKA